ncbi:lysylphosphatidylglycerol synthase transmembrane domain-containing protein [Enterovibrio coralii]|uniref:Lysylphosphatidylglycerol synthetase n=1 Tax=Enterovibrio coralii TaxID=294935 RepID=A0A135I7C9_9GAMM|nr:lysylphosphatidylglycerol synthase transmembrane domain-containing protein [Enterovibrio coralii]KXF81355.1 lysylphosphatidylglycerol synthetase [Enterovibrio coralii]
MKNLHKSLIGISTAALFGFLFLKDIDTNELVDLFYQIDLVYIVLAIVMFFFGYACRVERWRVMLKNDNPSLTWKACFSPLFISVAANNILPFRLGDIIRAFAFNKHLKISVSTSITTLLVERMLDLLMVITILGIILPYLDGEYSALIGIGGWGLILIGVIIVAILNFPKVFKPVFRVITSVLKSISVDVGNKVEEIFNKIFLALDYVSTGSTTVKLILWSAAAWVCEGLVFWLVALAIPTLTNTFAAWLALPIGTLATVIPSTPGYIGTFDYFTSEAMTMGGNSKISATVYALVLHLVIWIPPTIVGALCFIFKPIMSTSEIRKLS